MRFCFFHLLRRADYLAYVVGVCFLFFFFKGNYKWRSWMFASAEENISQVLGGKVEKENWRMLLVGMYMTGRVAVWLSTGNKKSQTMWRCNKTHFLCYVACWTVAWEAVYVYVRYSPLHSSAGVWTILHLVNPLCWSWPVLFVFFLTSATVKILNSYGEKRGCVSNLHRLAAECFSDPRQLWGVSAVQCSADMNAELFWHVLTLAWSLSPC